MSNRVIHKTKYRCRECTTLYDSREDAIDCCSPPFETTIAMCRVCGEEYNETLQAERCCDPEHIKGNIATAEANKERDLAIYQQEVNCLREKYNEAKQEWEYRIAFAIEKRLELADKIDNKLAELNAKLQRAIEFKEKESE